MPDSHGIMISDYLQIIMFDSHRNMFDSHSIMFASLRIMFDTHTIMFSQVFPYIKISNDNMFICRSYKNTAT